MSYYAEQPATKVRHLWLEITGRCNLECSHCYAESGPLSGHGTMLKKDWLRVLDQASTLGVGTIQFIGGEPTLHPDFVPLVRAAAAKSARVEVYSNLTNVKAEHWSTYKELKVSLATSFYSADRTVHDGATKRNGSQSRTLTNIKLAVAQDIPIRVAIINEQGRDNDEGETVDLLARAGVEHIAWDRVRGVGRGAEIHAEAHLDSLCGNCAASSVAVDPNGDVFPCVFARTVRVGNVHEACLADVIDGPAMQDRLSDLRGHFANRPPVVRAQCTPCGPEACNPNTPPPPCRPLEREHRKDQGRPPDRQPLKKVPIEKIPIKEQPFEKAPSKSV